MIFEIESRSLTFNSIAVPSHFWSRAAHSMMLWKWYQIRLYVQSVPTIGAPTITLFRLKYTTILQVNFSMYD